jgi:hypothetical protein
MSDLFDEKKKLKVFSLSGREIQHRVTLQPMSNVLGEIAAYDLSAQPVLPRYLSRHYWLSHFPLLAPPPKLSFLALRDGNRSGSGRVKQLPAREQRRCG